MKVVLGAELGSAKWNMAGEGGMVPLLKRVLETKLRVKLPKKTLNEREFYVCFLIFYCKYYYIFR